MKTKLKLITIVAAVTLSGWLWMSVLQAREKRAVVKEQPEAAEETKRLAAVEEAFRLGKIHGIRWEPSNGYGPPFDLPRPSLP